MVGSNNSAGIPGNYKVTGYGQQTSAAWEAEPKDLLLGPSGSIKGGLFCPNSEVSQIAYIRYWGAPLTNIR